jgi:hypothetical protein
LQGDVTPAGIDQIAIFCPTAASQSHTQNAVFRMNPDRCFRRQVIRNKGWNADAQVDDLPRQNFLGGPLCNFFFK